jgi:hypothetical protein
VRVTLVGSLWQVSIAHLTGAREDGESLAHDLRAAYESVKEEPVKDMEEPEDLEIPRFLEPEPDPLIPAELHSLSEPGETVREMQARLWLLYLELQNKVMMALASREEIRLHTTLHGHLNWLAPPLEGDL